MAVQKQSMPSVASIISVLSVVFYCVGFIRVELEMNEQKERISALENIAEAKPLSDDPEIKLIKDAPGKFLLQASVYNRIIILLGLVGPDENT